MIVGNIANSDTERKGVFRYCRLGADVGPGYTGVMKLRLKEYRLERRLTQRQVADLAGMSVSYYTELEKGTKQINANRLEQLAKVFAVSPQALISHDLAKVSGLAEAIEALPSESQELVRSLVTQLSGSARQR